MSDFYAVCYRHDYGTDLNLYATELDAYRAACTVIGDWSDDIVACDIYGELVELINNGEYKQALELWSEITCDAGIVEEITVQAVTLQSNIPAPKLGNGE